MAIRGPIEIRTLTAAEVTEQQRDGVRIAPGIWRDRDGNAHWSIPELLTEFGLDDTPATRAAVLGIIDKVIGVMAVDVIVQELDEGSEEPDGFLG